MSTGCRKPLSIDDVLGLVSVGGLDVSPRGDIAFTVTRSILEENKTVSGIIILYSSGEKAELWGQGDSSPKWSPDGSVLALASRRNASEKRKGQGLYIWSGRGDPREVAWFKHGILDYSWRSPESILVLAYEESEGYDKDGDLVETSELPLWFDGEGIVAGLTPALYQVDVDSGRVERISREGEHVRAFSAREDAIIYAVRRDWKKPYKSDLIIYDGSQYKKILEDMAIHEVEATSDSILLIGHRDEIGISSHGKLYRIDEAGKPACITCDRIDRDIASIAGMRNGEVYVTVYDRGTVRLYSINATTGEHKALTPEGFFIYNARLKGDTIALTASMADKPIEVYTGKVIEDGVSLKQATRYNEWLTRERMLYKPQHFTIRSEGDEVDVWVLGAEKGRPVALYIHGGPKGMYGYQFHYEMQLMASQGFAVVYANPRGSNGYTEEFADIRGKYGEVDYKQLMDALDEAIRRYKLDESRMFVTGISYGGYMTNVIVTKTSRFKAAVSENGIADWIADYWAADIGFWFDPDQIGGTPLDNLDEYVSKSPAFKAANVETPMLIIHSLEDYRCFIDQALAMHTALVMNGKESRLVVFKKGSHGHSVRGEPRHRKKRLEIKLKWVREKLGLAGDDLGESCN